MKKVTAILLAAMITVTSLGACSSGSGTIAPVGGNSENEVSETSSADEESVSEAESEAQSEASSSSLFYQESEAESETSSSSLFYQESEAESEAESKAASKAQADILSFEIELDGTKYSIPCAYTDFAKTGYLLTEDDDLNANTYTIGGYLKKAESETISVQFWNPTSETKKYSESQIGQVDLDLDDGLDIVLPGGFKFDDSVTPEKVIEFYGEPDSRNDGDGYVSITYEEDIYSTVNFFIYTTDDMKKYSSIKIQNLI